jgi:hypothetical protein
VQNPAVGLSFDDAVAWFELARQAHYTLKAGGSSLRSSSGNDCSTRNPVPSSTS